MLEQQSLVFALKCRGLGWMGLVQVVVEEGGS